MKLKLDLKLTRHQCQQSPVVVVSNSEHDVNNSTDVAEVVREHVSLLHQR
jgi:(2Fe-2S) ferredoxin